MRKCAAARALAPRAVATRAFMPRAAARCVTSRAAAARAVTSRPTAAPRSRRAPCRPLSAGLKAAADDEGGGLADEYSGTMDGSSGELHVVESFELESGRVLRDVGVKYKTWGNLNAARDNVLVVCHALTGSHELELWWGDLLGPGRAFDTDRYFVVCVNTLGSPYGSCSPLTPDGDAADGSAYGARFPHDATIRDAVGLQALVLKDAIGVDRVACAVGGSMGGMLALELCYQTDVPVESAVLLATNGRHGAWQIAISALQRQAVFSDPKYAGGDYGDDPPLRGLSVARQIAMVSYRTHNAYETKFGRESEAGAREGGPRLFDVESYLSYQGAKFIQRSFDANCYVALTRLMDSHDVARGRGKYPHVLRDVAQPTLVLGISSDVLYPLHEQQELAIHLANCRGFHAIDSDEGHDGFLLEQDAVTRHVTAFLKETFPEKYD